MSQLRFEMKPVEKKHEKVKKNIFDPIIDEFIKSGYDLAEITVEERKPNSVTSSLTKRIEVRGLEIEVSRVGGLIYLEKKSKNIG